MIFHNCCFKSFFQSIAESRIKFCASFSKLNCSEAIMKPRINQGILIHFQVYVWTIFSIQISSNLLSKENKSQFHAESLISMAIFLPVQQYKWNMNHIKSPTKPLFLPPTYIHLIMLRCKTTTEWTSFAFGGNLIPKHYE